MKYSTKACKLVNAVTKINFKNLIIVFIAGTSVQVYAQGSHNWSGAYVGGALSLVKGRATTNTSTTGPFTGSYFTSPDPTQISEVIGGDLKKTGVDVGGFAGFGQQFGNLYLGLEGGVSTLGLNDSRSRGAVYISNSAGKFENRIKVKTNVQAMLRTRLGWTQERWIAYVSGGLAATYIKINAKFTDNFLGAGAYGQSRNSQAKLGWTIGFGGEYALNKQWSLRGDYAFVDYGRIKASMDVKNPAFPTFGNEMTSSVKLRAQIISLGFVYRY